MSAVEDWAKPPDRTCAGCGELVPGAEIGWTWILGALGTVAVKTHCDPGCAELAVQRHPEQPAKRIPEPLSREERMKREQLAAQM